MAKSLAADEEVLFAGMLTGHQIVREPLIIIGVRPIMLPAL
jgi:hypothetical protein